MNYKSGDLVKIAGNCNGHRFEIGETVRLKRNCGGELRVWTAEYLDGHDFWYVRESDMKPFKPATMPQKIIITTDGKTTLARLFDGKTMVKRAEAKCAPSDVFDFGVGAELAVKRLMGGNPVTEPVKSESVKLYCFNDSLPYFTQGRAYEFKHGRIKMDNRESCRYASVDDFLSHNISFKSCLVPLVRRPAKVGEWVLIDGESELKQVRRKCCAWDGCIVLADGRHSKGKHEFTYLVLSGYTGDPT